MLSILLRAHRRPIKLTACLQSLVRANCPDLVVYAIQDDPTDTLSRKVLDSFRGVLSITDVPQSPKGYPGCNEYLNTTAPLARDGSWLFYLDDDDLIQHPDIFAMIEQVISSERPDLILLRFAQIKRSGEITILPPDPLWKKPPVSSQIGAPCICLPKDLAVRHQWGPTPTGDHDFIQSVYQSVRLERIYWLDAVGVTSSPSFGASEY